MNADPRSDHELFDAWCGGDKPAGHSLFTRHFPSILRFFRNKCDSDAEDLVQRSFEACARSRDRFRRDASFRTYLFGIARNILFEHIRWRQRDSERIVFESHSLADLGAGPSTVIGTREQQRVLLEALRRIPVEHQVLLELYFWEDLPANCIGEIFGLPENTVRSRLRRAKALLEKSIRRIESRKEILESTLGNLDEWAKSLRELMDRPDPNSSTDPRASVTTRLRPRHPPRDAVEKGRPMLLYDESGNPVPKTVEDNEPLRLTVSENNAWCTYGQHSVTMVNALAKERGTGTFDPDPDNDGVEEAIVTFHHDAGRTLTFTPAPQDVDPRGNDTYRVEFEMPNKASDPPYVWNGKIEVFEGATLKKTIPLQVTVTKGAGGPEETN